MALSKLSLAVLAAALGCGSALAAPLGNALVLTADSLGRGELYRDVSVFTGDNSTQAVWNSQFGIGYGVDLGIDIPLHGDSSPLFNVKWLCHHQESLRVAAGAQCLNGEGGGEAYAVFSLPKLKWTGHFGTVLSFPRVTPFVGLDLPVNSNTKALLEFVTGPDGGAAAGLEFSFSRGLGLIVSGVRDTDGNVDAFLDFIWAGKF